MTNGIDCYRWQTVSIDGPRPTARWILMRITSLLSHYYQPEVAEGVDELSMADWISTLGDLPQAAIDGAVQDWMRNETRRPTPAHIRQLAKARIEAPKPPPPDDDDMPFRPVVTDPAELERRREKAQKIMAEVASKLRRTEK